MVRLCNKRDNVRNEEVSPLVEQEIESLKPKETLIKIEVELGKKTTEKLQVLESIRHTSIDHLAELILASAMKNDESYWQELENSKQAIPNINNEKKSFIQGMKYKATSKHGANSTKSALKT